MNRAEPARTATNDTEAAISRDRRLGPGMVDGAAVGAVGVVRESAGSEVGGGSSERAVASGRGRSVTDRSIAQVRSSCLRPCGSAMVRRDGSGGFATEVLGTGGGRPGGRRPDRVG